MITRFTGYAIGSAVGVLTLGSLFQGGIIEYEDVRSVLLFALVLAALMTLIKPVLNVLTLPISCLTFGLFAVVINAALFWVATQSPAGVDATTIGCLLGSVLVSAVSGVVFAIIDE